MISTDELSTILERHGYTYQRPIGKGGFGTVYLVFSQKYKMSFVCKVKSLKPDEHKLHNEEEDLSDFNIYHKYEKEKKDIEIHHQNANNEQIHKIVKDNIDNNIDNNPKKVTIIDNNSEVLTNSNIVHTNIVSVYDYFNDQEYSFIILEYCEKGSLTEFLKTNGRIRSPYLEQMCFDLLCALKACHDKLIAHRDIKPGNILFDAHGRPKLADFGMSTQFQNGEMATRYGGSWPFLAPEILKNEHFDAFKTDIWALGVTFYIMSTGSLPWPKESFSHMKKAILGGYFGFNIVDVSKEIQTIIKSMIKVNVSRRATVDELLESPVFQGFKANSFSIFPSPINNLNGCYNISSVNCLAASAENFDRKNIDSNNYNNCCCNYIVNNTNKNNISLQISMTVPSNMGLSGRIATNRSSINMMRKSSTLHPQNIFTQRVAASLQSRVPSAFSIQNVIKKPVFQPTDIL